MNAMLRCSVAIVSVVFTLTISTSAYSYDWIDTTSEVKVRQSRTPAQSLIKEGYLLSRLRLANKTRDPIEGKLRVVITDSSLTPINYDGLTRLGDREGEDFPYYWITRENDASLEPREWTDTINIAFESPFNAWTEHAPRWLRHRINKLLRRYMDYEVLVENKPPLEGEGLIESDIWFRKITYNMDYDPDDPESLNIIPNPDSTSGIFRKNISKTPLLASNKAKFNVMAVYVPAMKADGTLMDERDVEDNCLVGTEIDGICQSKPLVAAYVDEIEGTGAQDVFIAISRDDGVSWKRKNVSKTAERSSFTLADGTAYPGDSRKPVFQVKGNGILITWSDKFCKAGRPAYAEILLDENGDPVLDDNGDEIRVYDDLYGVAGSQGSVNYDEIKDSEDLGLGEIPYSCVWAARSRVMLEDGEMPNPSNPTEMLPYTKGDILWYKPERLTSGRRDAYQLFVGGAADAGFAITWQEDPAGLRPGSAAGPGEGFSGATTNHKTDIWYNYLSWEDFAPIDEDDLPNGNLEPDPEADENAGGGLPLVRAANHMSMPVRISDNDVCNTSNMLLDDEEKDGSHSYCSADLNADGVMDNCAWSFDKVNEQGELKTVCVTDDQVILDGDTGASRPNLFLQPYYDKKLGKFRAWAILAYEETKGVGIGPPEETGIGNTDEPDPDDLGKDVIYESFSFDTPVTVSAGTRLNLPELGIGRDPETNEILHDLENLENNVPIWIDGELISATPTEGNSAGSIEIDTGRYATENARRIRFILQGKKPALGKETGTIIKNGVEVPTYAGAGTPLIGVYKQGVDGKGRPSDIMLRRINILNPDGTAKGGNPYQANYFVCDEWMEEDPTTCLEGALNMSSVTVLATEPSSQTDPDPEGSGGDDAAEKVVASAWYESNLQDPSWLNPYSEARAHRGQIRGDFAVMGYSLTPNWAASRNGHDKFDLFVRRSFDGGKTWTTAPASKPYYGEGVSHCVLVKEETGDGDEEGALAEEVCGTAEDPFVQLTVNLADGTTFSYDLQLWFEPGELEPPRNVSLLRNNKESVVEPRIVAIPGTIGKVDSSGTLLRTDENEIIWTGLVEDKQNPAVFMTSYGLEVNWTDQEADEDGNLPGPLPTDMYYARSTDRGENFETVLVIPTNTDKFPEGEERWDWLAKGEEAQGEAQLRLTPAGNKFYSCWLEELEVEAE